MIEDGTAEWRPLCVLSTHDKLLNYDSFVEIFNVIVLIFSFNFIKLDRTQIVCLLKSNHLASKSILSCHLKFQPKNIRNNNQLLFSYLTLIC